MTDERAACAGGFGDGRGVSGGSGPHDRGGFRDDGGVRDDGGDGRGVRDDGDRGDGRPERGDGVRGERDVRGIHHTGILTRDLDALERTYAALGFTLSPRSRHLLAGRPGEAPVLGCTANRCALFGGSYIELLGIVDESAPDPWHTRAMADEYEGFRLLNLDTGDAGAVHRRLAAAGLRTSGVLELERGTDTEEGPRTVRARAVHLDPRDTPEGYLGIAQHLTRAYVHQPRYLRHRNGARGLAAVLVVAADAAFDAVTDRYARILRTAPAPEGPAAVLDAGGAALRIVRASDAGELLPGEPVPAPSYLAAMTVAVDDTAAARALVEGGGTPTRAAGDGFFVSARHAGGAGLFFTPVRGTGAPG